MIFDPKTSRLCAAEFGSLCFVNSVRIEAEVSMIEKIIHSKLKFRQNFDTLTSMRRDLQSHNRINGDYEKTTGPIYLKF